MSATNKTAKKNVTFKCSDDLQIQLKVDAINNSTTMSLLVEKIVEEYYKKKEAESDNQ